MKDAARKDGHVTLYDVAARAGVSASTASRALAGLAVKPASRAAVERSAAELGYVPNEAARSLRVVRTMTVGMVFLDLTSRLGIELLGGLSSGLDALGYSLFVSTAQGEPDRYDRLVRRFLERRVDALVCVHGRGEGAALDRYAAAGIPALSMISQGGGYARLPLIGPSVGDAARAACADVARLGHAHVAVVTPSRGAGLMGEVLAAARAGPFALTELRAEPDAASLVPGLLASGGPTVVIAPQAHAREIADAAGSAAPGRLSVIAVGDRSPAALRPALATLELEPARMAEVATEALRRWLDDKVPLEGRTRVQTGAWRPAPSLGPAP